MPVPEIIRQVNLQRSALQAHEASTMLRMSAQWGNVMDSLQADMDDLAEYLQKLTDAGETVSQARLLQMDRYRNLIAEAQSEQAQYSIWASNAIALDQRAMLATGVNNGTDLLRAALDDAKVKGFAFQRLNAGAIDYAIGFAADGSPLFNLLQASYPESALRLTDDLVKGLASGKGAKETAKIMATAMNGNLDRSMLIAITEQNRALRAGAIEQMQSSGITKSYTRRSQRNDTVCPACLALDGEVFPVEEVFASHPRCHCFATPNLVFSATPQYENGKDWLERQPDSVQLEVLGRGKFDLLKQGKLDWNEVAQIHNDPIWGPTIRQGTIAQVTKGPNWVPPTPVPPPPSPAPTVPTSKTFDELTTKDDFQKWLKTETGANVVFLTKMPLSDMRILAKEIVDVRAVTSPKGWDKLKIRPASFAEQAKMGSTVAHYSSRNYQIVYHPDKIGAATKAGMGKSCVASNWWVTDKTLQHELGHALHHGQSRGIWSRLLNYYSSGSAEETWSNSMWKMNYTGGGDPYTIAQKVSRYGSTQPLEFVAETFSGLVDGVRYPADVMKLYKALHGPVVTPIGVP